MMDSKCSQFEDILGGGLKRLYYLKEKLTHDIVEDMTKPQEFFRSHPDPIVQVLLNTELTPEHMIPALSHPSIASHPKVKAFGLILLADSGFRPFEDANQFAQSVYMSPCHVDLQILFLAAWYGILIALEEVPVDHTKAIEAAMDALVDNDTPPEIRATVNLVKSRNKAYCWDFAAVFSIIDTILDGIPQSSPFYKKYSVMRAMGFFAHGLGTHVKDDIQNIELTDFDEKGLLLTQFADCALTGKFSQIPNLIEKISPFPNHKYRQVLCHSFEMACTMISLICNFRGIALPSTLLSESSDHNKSWARSTQALLEHKPEEALHWARITTDQYTSRFGEPLDFIEHTLVRAELANENGSGAKRLLLGMRAKGTELYMDNFYFARAELLLGNKDAAAIHFAKIKELVDQYESHNRFDFEVSLACELGACDLLSLGAEAIEVSRKGLEVAVTKKSTSKGLDSIISVSPSMFSAKESVVLFANLDLPVLITGETGTGKELIAKALHETSKRASSKFIAINCSSIPDALIESEFFGHTPGAFTGARSAYHGIFRDADDGTVFLDEIADISAQLQISLLRFLETGEVRPIGSSTLHMTKCRVIVATNMPLLQLVEEGKFRRDLYFRLTQLEINLPALRDRPEDIAVIAKHFFESDRQPAKKVKISQELLNEFSQYHWPGNVRELRNIVTRLRILSSDKLSYDVDDLERCGYTLQNTQGYRTSASALEPTIYRSETDYPINGEALNEGNSSFRRKRKLQELINEHKELRISEAAEFLGVTPNTASRYLVELSKQGIIEKVTPTASTKSHYYRIKI